MKIYRYILLMILALVACSDGSISPPTLSLLAGNMSGPGNADGSGAAARFYSPLGITSDSAGNLYVADTNNNTIRKITAAGVVTTLAGTAGMFGSTDGTGAAASFFAPCAITSDNAGNLYVVDSPTHTIRKITAAGVVTTLAGTPGVFGSNDGIGAAASFQDPCGITSDGAGNLYVADTGNNAIRKITATGVVTTLAGTAGISGSSDGTGAAASFNNPRGIASDSTSNLYVADTLNHTIRKITAAGVVTTLAGTAGMFGSSDGTGAAASFFYPQGITSDSVGNLYVTDSINTIRKITPAGVVTTLAGTPWVSGSSDGTGAAASFNSPHGIASDSTGNLYVTDTLNYTIRKITAAGVVTTFSGTPGVSGSNDGIGAAASFLYPDGITSDSRGNLYVADTFNNIIRKITAAGVVTTLAGTPGVSGSNDGIGAAASFSLPFGITSNSVGNLYVADTFNNTIRKITAAGVVTTLAGTAGVSGSNDGIGAAASFFAPRGIASDSMGNLYVTDTENKTIRKITASGVVTTLAGTPGVFGSNDGIGAAASFNEPRGITSDSAGNLYVTDTNNRTIRKITPAGGVTTFAGTPGVSISTLRGITSDSAGNLYVADTYNHIIRKITPAGVVTTVVGVAGQSGFVPGALPGIIGYPRSVAIHGNALYITLYNGVAAVNGLP